MEAFNSEVLLVRSSSERRKITKNAVDEIAGGGGAKGQYGALHNYQFPFKVLGMCRKVQEFGSMRFYIYLSVGYCKTFR